VARNIEGRNAGRSFVGNSVGTQWRIPDVNIDHGNGRWGYDLDWIGWESFTVAGFDIKYIWHSVPISWVLYNNSPRIYPQKINYTK